MKGCSNAKKCHFRKIPVSIRLVRCYVPIFDMMGVQNTLNHYTMSDPTYTYVDNLLSDCQTITESYERVAQASGDNFNLFTILGLETKEVATHSRFIAELLNPKGSHGRGEKFLELFLQVVGVNDFDTKGARVEVEHSFRVQRKGKTISGRIDIYITSRGGIIMIENKVYAYEQDKQLTTYREYRENGHLIYLTLGGEISSEDTDLNEAYYCKSYREDIKNWLELCRREAVDAPLLRESITLYLNLVKKLTNQTINKEMEKEIVEKIIRDGNSLKAFGNLLSAHHSIVRRILVEDVIEVAKVIGNELGLVSIPVWGFPEPNKGAGIHFSNSKLEELKIRIGFEFENRLWDKMFYGFYSGFNGKAGFQDLKERFKNKIGRSAAATDYWPCSNYWDEYYNFTDTNTLSKIRYGNFKSDLRELVKTLYEVATSYEINEPTWT